MSTKVKNEKKKRREWAFCFFVYLGLYFSPIGFWLSIFLLYTISAPFLVRLLFYIPYFAAYFFSSSNVLIHLFYIYPMSLERMHIS